MDKIISKILLIVVVIFIAFHFTKLLYATFGLITTIGFIIAVIYGFLDILKNPNRILAWGAGYYLGAYVLKFFFENILSYINFQTPIAILSSLISFYVLLMLFMEAKKLKKS